MRFYILFLVTVLTVVCGCPSFASSVPHVTNVPSCLHLVYDIECVEKALPPSSIEPTVAAMEQRGKNEPHLHEMIAGLRSRTVDRLRWKGVANYWVAAPSYSRWELGPNAILTDRTKTAALYIGKLSKGRQYADLLVNPLNGETPDEVKGTGVCEERIPFFGFAQPGKQYEGKDRHIEKTKNGWVEHTTLVHGYRQGNGGQMEKIPSVLTFDARGRLVRFERGDDIYSYRDFVAVDHNAHYPRTVMREDKNIFVVNCPGGAVDSVTTYTVRTADTKQMPANFFTVGKPPVGVRVSDARFRGPGAPTGVQYIYPSNAKTLDEASRYALACSKNTFERTHGFWGAAALKVVLWGVTGVLLVGCIRTLIRKASGGRS